ncbi:MAG: peptidoglycan-binding protein [Ilumatobacteraceae bacterium]
MRRPLPRVAALAVASIVAGSAAWYSAPSSSPVAEAASTPWYTPTRPPVCSDEQKNSGNVAGCVITLVTDLPEERGWATPPFPDPVPGDVLPWVDLARGATGYVVSDVQKALNANGADIVVDGQFGSQTETAVKRFQIAKGMTSTGIVNQATADALGVQNRTYTFPPPGWSWLGWGYNGSTALAGWEKALASNTSTFGAVRLGSLRTPPAALPLFEGFLKEIQSKGYVINGGTGTYVFRCTATTRKDCAGLARASLSNHAYGLATDFNTVANPLKTYYSIDGVTACQTPMETDIPQWVVQVAEKWGLYWGGYGWSSGCQSTTQWRSSVSRDPMHFEFNGTPDQAKRIANVNGPGGACFDTASTSGTISLMCLAKGQPVPSGTRVVVYTGAPPGAAASLVNLTSIASANGTVTAEGCGAVTTPRQYSTMNVRASRAVASMTVVPVDSKGRVCLYVSSAMHLIVDVQGFFVPAAQAPLGLHLAPVTPRVTVDTRTNAFCLADDTCFDRGPVPKGDEVRITTATSLPAVGVLANLTVFGAATNGNQVAKDCATLQPGTQPFSNLNFLASESISNLAVIRADDIGTEVEYCTYAIATLNELNEVLGLLVPASAGGQPFALLPQSRLIDTRQCWTDPITLVQTCGTAIPAGSVIRIAAPAGASNLFVKVASVDAAGAGYATVRACSAMTTPPATPTVNAVVGASASNTSTVRVGADGTFCVYVSSTMHVVVDVIGNFSAAGTLRFVMDDPVRVEDTRKPG